MNKMQVSFTHLKTPLCKAGETWKLVSWGQSARILVFSGGLHFLVLFACWGKATMGPACCCFVEWADILGGGRTDLDLGCQVTWPLYTTVCSASCLPMLRGVCSQHSQSRPQAHHRLKIWTYMVTSPMYDVCGLRNRLVTESPIYFWKWF